MSKTVLQIAQQFCLARGLPKPAALASSTDDTYTQILALLNEGLDELVTEKWAQLQLVTTFTSTAVESQGKLATLAPGYTSMISQTLWNLTNKLPANGSVSPQDSQYLRIWGRPNNVTNFRTVQGELHFIPAQPAGKSYGFEYNSNFAVLAADNVTVKQYFTADTDTCLIPDNVIALDLAWRWRAEKGLPYAEAMATCEKVKKQAKVDALAANTLTMDNGERNLVPGVVVPLGNWQRP